MPLWQRQLPDLVGKSRETLSNCTAVHCPASAAGLQGCSRNSMNLGPNPARNPIDCTPTCASESRSDMHFASGPKATARTVLTFQTNSSRVTHSNGRQLHWLVCFSLKPQFSDAYFQIDTYCPRGHSTHLRDCVSRDLKFVDLLGNYLL